MSIFHFTKKNKILFFLFFILNSHLYSNVENNKNISFGIPFIKNNKQACLLISLGQSNAEGVSSLPRDKYSVNLKNVKMLSRQSVIQKRYLKNESNWRWVPFDSQNSKQNLGRGFSAKKSNFINNFARLWQDEIDSGKILPDLYIIQIAWSGNGWTAPDNRWLAESRFAGTSQDLSTLSFKTHQWAIKNLSQQFEIVHHLGINWNQWENDGKTKQGADSYVSNLFNLVYKHYEIAGQPIPFGYFYPQTKGVDGRFKYMKKQQNNFNTIHKRLQEMGALVKKFDVKDLSFYNENKISKRNHLGIYSDDVHYKHKVFDQFSSQYFKKIKAKKNQIPLLVLSKNKKKQIKLDPPDDISINISADSFKANEDKDLSLSKMEKSGFQTQEKLVAIKNSNDKNFFKIVNRKKKLLFLNTSNKSLNYGSVTLSVAKGSRLALAAVFLLNDKSGTTFNNSGKEYIALALSCDIQDYNLKNKNQYASKVWHAGRSVLVKSSKVMSNNDLPLGAGTSGITEDVQVRFSMIEGSSKNKATFIISYRVDKDSSFKEMFRHEDVNIAGVSAKMKSGGSMGISFGLGTVGKPKMIETIGIYKINIINQKK